MNGAALALGILLAAATVRAGAQQPAYDWKIPAPFPRPPVPADNPMTAAKVLLGRHLFYDSRLSGNKSQSCADCHQQSMAFTEGRGRAIGSTGLQHPRSSMSLANVAYNTAFTWANPDLVSLEHQARVPLFGQHPVEMGIHGQEQRFLDEARADTAYARLFPAAFPGEESYTLPNVFKALAAFQRTLISVSSAYDRYRYGGDSNAISPSAKRGEAFFFSGQRGSCFQCHGGWNFKGAIRHEGTPAAAPAFFNTGLYNIAGPTSYPEPNTGLHQFSHRLEDVGLFHPPTLRNIAVTAPYMHDGSIATLGEVLDHYAAGGRTIASGPNRGVGHDNPRKSLRIRPLAMSAGLKADLIAFLETLTDSAFLRNPAHSNPWNRAARAPR